MTLPVTRVHGARGARDAYLRAMSSNTAALASLTPRRGCPYGCAGVDLNPFSYEFHEDPYPTYRWLRDHAPLYRNQELDFWALSRHRDVLAASLAWYCFDRESHLLAHTLSSIFCLTTDTNLRDAIVSAVGPAPGELARRARSSSEGGQ